jgi:hypothetical protein
MNEFHLPALNISEDIRQEFSIDRNGRGKISQRGAAKLLGVTRKVVQEPSVTLAQSLRNAGLEGGTFEDGVTDVEFAVLALYVAFESPATNPQAVAVVKSLAAIGARALFHSMSGWRTPKLELSASSDGERVGNLAQCASLQIATPKDKIDLTEWLTITEMLTTAGKDRPELVGRLKSDKFRYWINRQIADIYRAQYGCEPPTVYRRKSSRLCYPPSFQALVSRYLANWNQQRSGTNSPDLGG